MNPRTFTNIDTLNYITVEYGLDVTPITEHQYRFVIAGATWDWYPKSGKINLVGTSLYEAVDLKVWVKSKIDA